MMKKGIQKVKYLVLGALLASIGLWALAVTLPHTFASGDEIKSAEMNANFTALKNAVDALEAKMDGLATKQGYVRAHVFVLADGTVKTAYTTDGATVTVTKGGTGYYTIELVGENLIIWDDPMQVTPVTDGVACRATTSGGKARVNCKALSGAAQDATFWITIFND